MANPQGIVHPQMLSRLQTNFYPSACTIQEAAVTQNSYGTPVQSWSNLADHVDLPCRVAPDRRRNVERRTDDQTYGDFTWEIALAGYYPAITETMRAVVSGQAYDIEVPQHDGQSKTTHLLVRLAR